MTCTSFAGLTGPQANQIERLARNRGESVETTLIQTEAASGWWVRMPPAASRQAAEQRAQQLRELGVSDLYVVHAAGPEQNAISLGVFRGEASATQHLEDLQQQGVVGAEVAVRNPARYRLELNAPADVLEDVLRRLPESVRQAARESCRR